MHLWQRGPKTFHLMISVSYNWAARTSPERKFKKHFEEENAAYRTQYYTQVNCFMIERSADASYCKIGEECTEKSCGRSLASVVEHHNEILG